ncbi:NAD(P)/FAD-dependent oxidoreductase [Psychroflexus tropicus]|uniref:NAD(P)/FAD-dependent oxidoreductase n=1 Tax=Psychroflexus tropicus TaxID=197345 RepID=UPI00037517AD|nr:FAD/NAD(P)-binding oxidoreductase [Psychroflexus tropicus]
MKSKYSVLIIGGGTAGIMTAAQLLKKDSSLSIGIIDPADTHYYQPAWTLVGGGTYNYDDTAKPMKDLIPEGADWIQDYATGFDADNNIVKTQNSGEIAYDYLVVAPGLVMDLTLIDGLESALGKGVVCSNYTDPKHTWEVIQNFKGGNAVFTQPTTPIKCGGAPQKIAYLAADHFRKNKVNARVIFATPGTVLFGVKEIRETLQKVVDRYGMHFKPFYAPIKIDADKKIITYKYVGDDENQCVTNESKEIGERISGEALIDMPFDMLHLAPPQTAPKFIKESNLVNQDGWVDVNINSLQHNTYPNIFALGDVAALPTAKTGAAIRKQVPVVVENLTFMMNNKPASNKDYKGYSSCPLVTGYGKMALAEFDYEGNFTPDPKLKQMLVFNSAKEHWRLWMLKKYGLPYLYWNKMMKGEAV